MTKKNPIHPSTFSIIFKSNSKIKKNNRTLHTHIYCIHLGIYLNKSGDDVMRGSNVRKSNDGVRKGDKRCRETEGENEERKTKRTL